MSSDQSVAGRTIARFSHWMLDVKRASYASSAVRIIYGIALLLYFIPTFKDRHYLWGLGSTWLDPRATRQSWWEAFNFLFPKDNRTLFDLHYLIFLALIVLFIIGWRTRIVTPFLGFFYLSLVVNSVILSDGGDNLVRITFLFFIFMDLSQHWSIDARRHRKRAEVGNSSHILPSWLSTPAHNAGVILCGYQIILVYVASGLYKSQGTEWANGTALYYSMILDAFNVQPLLSQIVWQSTFFVAVGTFLSIWVQMLFPILVLWRPSRVFALLFLMSMHLGIALFLGLWPFSLPMIALDLIFIRDSSWRSASRWIGTFGKSLNWSGKNLVA